MPSMSVACPFLAQSGHPLVHCTCLLSGVKRTCRFAVQMSAFDPKRTWVARIVAMQLNPDPIPSVANPCCNRVTPSIFRRGLSLGGGDATTHLHSRNCHSGGGMAAHCARAAAAA